MADLHSPGTPQDPATDETDSAPLRAPRPLTHDLIGRVIHQLGHELRRVVITELKDSTFYAVLVLTSEDGSEHVVDCRPSDAIALAVQASAKIFVSKEVLDIVAPG